MKKDERGIEEIIYYPIVESDAEEFKEFSEDELESGQQELEKYKQELEIDEPFEDCLKKLKSRYISYTSHTNQNIEVNRIGKFEFECQKNMLI